MLRNTLSLCSSVLYRWGQWFCCPPPNHQLLPQFWCPSVLKQTKDSIIITTNLNNLLSQERVLKINSTANQCLKLGNLLQWGKKCKNKISKNVHYLYKNGDSQNGGRESFLQAFFGNFKGLLYSLHKLNKLMLAYTFFINTILNKKIQHLTHQHLL